MDLPNEIYALIIQSCAGSDYICLSMVASNFYEICKMYRNKLEDTDDFVHAIMDEDEYSLLRGNEYYYDYERKIDVRRIADCMGFVKNNNIISILNNKFGFGIVTEMLCIGACKAGNVKLMVEIIYDYKNDRYIHWDNIFLNACAAGHMSIIKLFLMTCDYEKNAGFEGACIGDNKDVMKLLLKHDVWEDDIIASVCGYKSIKVIELLIKKDIMIVTGILYC